MYTALIAPILIWALFTGMAYQAYSQNKKLKLNPNSRIKSEKTPNRMVATEKVYPTAQFGFAQAIISGEFIFTSGQVGWNVNHQLETDQQDNRPNTKLCFESQVKQCFLNVEQILLAGNSSMNQVVMLRFYVKDLNDFKRTVVNGYLKSFYPTHYKPATTLIGVTSLAQKDLLIEIEAIAKKNPK